MFTLGAYADPIFLSGDYPQILKERVGDRLPVFTDDQKKMLKGSADFFAINHYFT
jgi:beta-glucosidase/6-phospho-beta-glucosidase/beta-galactosidase